MAENKGIILNDIYLSSSTFNRPKVYSAEDEQKLELTINIQKEIKGNQLVSTLNVSIILNAVADKQTIGTTEMTGIFSFTNESPIEVEVFAQINAPAILYPFVREHFASISAKANMRRILLPTINFVVLSEQQKK